MSSKNATSLSPDYFIYKREIISSITRQNNLLHFPKVRTEAAKRSFFCNALQYLIMILVEIIYYFSSFNYYNTYLFCYTFSHLYAICYLMYIYLRLYNIYFVNNYFSELLLITVLIIALIGPPC